MKLKNYELIHTQDGSYTAYSKLYDEACHSSQGAVKETIKHYIEGCKIKDALKRDHTNILEVGLGVGIGLIQTLKVIENESCHFVSLEIDEDLVKYLIENVSELKHMQKVSSYLYQGKIKNTTISILVGNARTTLAKFLKDNPLKFHAIYQDAFSPKKNAILWTKEWFETLYNCADKTCILSTYSASSSIRKALIAAKWKVKNGDKFGNKKSSTRAVLTGESDKDILLHLERSPVILLTDDNYENYTLEATHAKK